MNTRSRPNVGLPVGSPAIAETDPEPNILATVVTYNPGADFGRSLLSITSQIEHVVVIDNGSHDFNSIAGTALALGCRFVGNGRNFGIARALNQAVKMARTEGFDWLATYDQDTFMPPGTLSAMLEIYRTHPDRDRIAILGISHRDRSTGLDYHHGFDVIAGTAAWRSVRSTITSGSLVRTSVFDQVGGFDEHLFIDAVDHDFCLRCRRARMLVIEERAHVAEHAIGASTVRNVLGLNLISHHYSPERYYYICRNTLEVAARNFTSDFLWSIQALALLAARGLCVIAFEKNRPAKVWAMIVGAGHFLVRRFGPR